MRLTSARLAIARYVPLPFVAEYVLGASPHSRQRSSSATAVAWSPIVAAAIACSRRTSVKPGKSAQDLVAARARLREVAGHPQRADEPAGERRARSRRWRCAGRRGRAATRTRTCPARRRVSPAAAYSEPRLNAQERAVEALGDLALEQLDVAARLLLRVADRAEVAVVVDPHVGDREALGEEGGQVLGDLLVDAALEAQARAVAEDAQRVVRDGGRRPPACRCGSSPAGSGPRARSGRSGRAGARRRPRRGPRPRPGT